VNLAHGLALFFAAPMAGAQTLHPSGAAAAGNFTRPPLFGGFGSVSPKVSAIVKLAKTTRIVRLPAFGNRAFSYTGHIDSFSVGQPPSVPALRGHSQSSAYSSSS
jgi:hypothetical protein